MSNGTKTSQAYLHAGHRLLFMEMAEGARSKDVVALSYKAMGHPEFQPGWRLALDQRRSGSLVDFDLAGAGEMYRSARELGLVQVALIHDARQRIMNLETIRGATGFDADGLRAFVDMDRALAWLGLPPDYDTKAGIAITAD